MIISYHPFYSVLHNCSNDYVEHLSRLLEHSIPIELLQPFKKYNELILTTKYLFQAYKNSDDDFDVRVYSGFLSKILKDIYSNYSDLSNIEFINFVNKYVCTNKELNSILMQHQGDIVLKCLEAKRGIVKSPTSSGKSFCIAELVNKFLDDELKVLVTVPTISLLHQMESDINTYRKLTNQPDLTIGKVGDGLLDISNLTIGIPNSLCKLNKTKNYLNSIDVLIADEVHLCATSMYMSILQNSINRKVTLGFSATPEIKNGIDKLLEGMFGERIITITEDQMIKRNVILEPLFKFYNSPNAFVPAKLSTSALNISNLTDQHRYKLMPQVYNYVISNNVGRNNIIVNAALTEIKKEQGPIIIIVNKVKGENNHADILRSLFLERGVDLPIFSGYSSAKVRKTILESLHEESIKGVIAGPKVLTAGVSIPSLSCIILAGAGKSDIDFIQRVGRLLRKKEGKERPLVIDFYDQQFWFKNQSNSRIATAKDIYGKNNVQIY
jgi:superfamily II DNA or RNA helicase